MASMMKNLFGGQPSFNLPGPLGGIANLVQKFNQFRQNPMAALINTGVQFPDSVQGNPEAMVNYLRNSGQMTEEQFSQFSQLAGQFQSFIGKRS